MTRPRSAGTTHGAAQPCRCPMPADVRSSGPGCACGEPGAALQAVLLVGAHGRVATRATGWGGFAHRAPPAAWAATGRPQLAQKREPHRSGAPQSQRAEREPPGVRPGRAEQGVELVDPGLEPDQLGAALEQEVSAELIAPVHLEREPAEVAQLLLAQAHQGAALAAQVARRGHWTSPSRRRRWRRVWIDGLPAQELLQRRETQHGASVLGASERLSRPVQRSITTSRSSVSSRTAYAGPSRVFPESLTPP